jgi:hypothetical protein
MFGSRFQLIRDGECVIIMGRTTRAQPVHALVQPAARTGTPLGSASGTRNKD